MVKEMFATGFNLGYRLMWQRLMIRYNIIIKRDSVYKIMKVADPEGLKRRFGNRLRKRVYKNPGPNSCWHEDGYDKIKQFGFAIHGAVDG